MARNKNNTLNPTAYGLTVQEATRLIRIHDLCKGMDDDAFEQMETAFNQARETKGVPSAIVMKTVKGKGISFMENDAGWPGKAPNDQQLEQAVSELKAKIKELEGN